jgi:hypothetical protein
MYFSGVGSSTDDVDPVRVRNSGDESCEASIAVATWATFLPFCPPRVPFPVDTISISSTFFFMSGPVIGSDAFFSISGRFGSSVLPLPPSHTRDVSDLPYMVVSRLRAMYHCPKSARERAVARSRAPNPLN